MKERSLTIQNLGQAGFRFELAKTVILIDPYLSNSVQEKESKDLFRLQPVPVQPPEVNDTDWILITHEHRDHCDIDTLLPISKASQNCRFIGPPNVATLLKKAGIAPRRILTAEPGIPLQLQSGWNIHPVPAAHPNTELDCQSRHRWLGYVMQVGSLNIYHAGDTSPDEEITNAVKRFGVIDFAFLPVNERNYFLNRRGIIGNMSIREAFQFAEEIGVKALIPTHWNMFEANSVYKEEIELLYKKFSPPFSLFFVPDYPAHTTLPC